MSDRDILKMLVNRNGADWITRELSNASDIEGKQGTILTIVANVGVHPLPKEMLRGEVVFASEGSLDFSAMEIIKSQYISILEKIASKLKERDWTEIYILPFGHCTLSMQIKLLVYRVTRIEAQEIFHIGGGQYGLLDIEQRPLIIGA